MINFLKAGTYKDTKNIKKTKFLTTPKPLTLVIDIAFIVSEISRERLLLLIIHNRSSPNYELQTFSTLYLAYQDQSTLPHSGELFTWGSPQIEALTMAEAQQWCDENMGYLKVIGRLTMTVPGRRDEDGNHCPDWENRVDLDEGKWN